MKITESLSKGLKNRFFLELADEINKKGQNNPYQNIKVKRTNWGKCVSAFKTYHKKFTFIFYEGGSQRKPYIGAAGLHINQKREFNQWNEKCLEGVVAVASWDPVVYEYFPGFFNIGEHVISRLYERGKVRFINEFEVDIFSIMPEFKMVPLWSGFWTLVFLVFKHNNLHFKEIAEIYPVIPCDSGLLLGEIGSGKTDVLEIRTFVDFNNLNFDQQEVRKILIKISEGLIESPICLMPIVQITKIDHYLFQTSLMAFEVLKSYDVISRVLFHRIEDDKLRAKLKEEFKFSLKEYSNHVSQEELDICRKLGIRSTQILVKKTIFKEQVKRIR